MVKVRLDEKGTFSIPIGLLFLTLAVAAFGILGVLRNWRGKMVTQLEIDRCVGQASLQLRDSLHQLGVLNQAMVVTRASLATAGIIPAVRASLQATLEAETVAEDVVMGKWIAVSLGWMAARGCRSGQSDIPKPIPRLTLHRPPPDSLGSQPLEWDDQSSSHEFTVWLAHPPRYAAATVSTKENHDDDDDSPSTENLETTVGLSALPVTWHANWSNPLPQGLGRFLSH